MRVLFATYSEKTHFHAMVPLAWALRTAGHDVRVASQPALVDVITSTGLTAVPVGQDHNLWNASRRFLTQRFAEVNPEAYKKIRGVELPPFDVAELPTDQVSWDYLKDGYDKVVPSWYRMINDPMVEDLVAFARAWRPDLVIWEPATYAGPIAAAASGAVHARLPWSLDIFGRTREHFLRLKHRRGSTEDALADWLGAHAEKFGVEFAEELTTGQFTIDQFPDSLRMEADGLRYVPMRYVPYNGDAVVPKWLWDKPAKPRVCLTLGVCATERFGGYPVGVQGILDALAGLDVEIVATVAEDEQRKLTSVPDNTKLVSFVPLHALVPSCSAVIHHAGFGTANTTALHGVPQLAMPEQHDAPPLARRTAAQGAGLTIYYSEVTGEKVRAGLVRLLEEDSFTESAGRLREEILALPSPNDVVPELERLTARLSGR
ncbi:activator-dependent family glycosyltransferase [Actinosynnema sp. NPDC023587]|uniref:activator-dependent family glycosyltransferase n=1 Tax=Actinosynnema sp. NPDC023587 TaxID=3154695 RepID=UPI0033F8BAD5